MWLQLTLIATPMPIGGKNERLSSYYTFNHCFIRRVANLPHLCQKQKAKNHEET